VESEEIGRIILETLYIQRCQEGNSIDKEVLKEVLNLEESTMNPILESLITRGLISENKKLLHLTDKAMIEMETRERSYCPFI
jgi:predicted transcriptional regulator